jgi:hypothetical protein
VYFVYGRADYPLAAGGVAGGGSMAPGGSADSPPAIVEINLVDDGGAVPGSSTDLAPGASSSSSNAAHVAMPADEEAEVASPGSTATSGPTEAPWRRRHRVKKPSPPA